MFNRSNNNDGIGAAILDGENRQSAALLAKVLLTIVLRVLLRKKLSQSYRHLLGEAEHGPATAQHGGDELGDGDPPVVGLERRAVSPVGRRHPGFAMHGPLTRPGRGASASRESARLMPDAHRVVRRKRRVMKP